MARNAEFGRTDRIMLVALGVLLSAMAYAGILLTTPDFAVVLPFGRDFLNFWMGGRVALEGRAEVLVDLARYDEAARALFHFTDDLFVFSYPPPILPLLAPFGALPYAPALLAWTGLNLAALWASARLVTSDNRIALAACISPAAAIMVVAGQFGGFLAFGATYALKYAEARPARAGLCLALIAVKPQMAVALGLMLLLAGRWRAVLWSIPPGLALLGLSVALFGLDLWRGYVAQILPYQTSLLSNFVFQNLSTALSPYLGFRRIGLGSDLSWALQYAVSAAVVWLGARRLRGGGGEPADLLPPLLALLVAQPYANYYDLAIAAPVMAAVFLGPPRPGAVTPLAPIPALLLWLVPVLALLTKLKSVPIAIAILTGCALYLLLRRTAAGAGPQKGPPSPAALDCRD
ncbi:MAG: glycosyltransferase family 87 protein [Phenylobacterium sp.]|uniref:glycosyltransferase family 87 protein n=1 Tax=Phenylobacterium sp. TaxID=1871053 RepID=UPI003918A9D6